MAQITLPNSKLRANAIRPYRNSKLILLDLLAIAAILALGTLVYYGRQEPPDSALLRVQSSHTLRVGMDPTYAPFESYVAGKLVGYDVDLAAYVAKAIGPDVQVQLVPIATDALYSKLAANDVDMIISALPYIHERSADVIYTRAYFNAAPVLVVPASSSIKGVADLGGKRVGVELGSQGDEQARRYNRDHPAAPLLLTTFDLSTDAFAALTSGQLDAIIIDPIANAAWQVAHPDLTNTLTNVGDIPYVVAVGKNSKQLARLADNAIAQAQSSGKLDELAANWFR
jgi:ABC-type amino acid transport substrate-binding protein